MTKPYIRRKPFCAQPAAKPAPENISENSEFLSLDYLDAVSCFETLRLYTGRFFCLDGHLDRLNETCVGLGKKMPLSVSAVRRWLLDAAEASGFPDAIARLSLHWSRRNPNEGEAVVLIREFLGYPTAWYENGVDFTSTTLRRSSPRALDPQLKVSQYVSGVLAMLDRGENGAHELLFLGDPGTSAEGSVSNVFIVRDGCVLTPSAASGILRGVTRSIVMALAGQCGYSVRETQLTRHELYAADECWMTNTSSEILPVTRMDARIIGDGRPGPVTRRLAQFFKDEIKRHLT